MVNDLFVLGEVKKVAFLAISSITKSIISGAQQIAEYGSLFLSDHPFLATLLVAFIFIFILLFVVDALLSYFRGKKAAEDLLVEVRSARQAFTAYEAETNLTRNAYTTNAAILAPQIPNLKIKVDAVKVGTDYKTNCESMERRANSFRVLPCRRRLFTRIYTTATMFSSLITLLRGSKTSSFLHSARMLEDYFKRRNATGNKRRALDLFIDEFYEFTVFELYQTLETEQKTFNGLKPLLDQLEKDLKTV